MVRKGKNIFYNNTYTYSTKYAFGITNNNNTEFLTFSIIEFGFYGGRSCGKILNSDDKRLLCNISGHRRLTNCLSGSLSDNRWHTGCLSVSISFMDYPSSDKRCFGRFTAYLSVSKS